MQDVEESEIELMIPRQVGNNNETLIDLLEAGSAMTEIDDQHKVISNVKSSKSMNIMPFWITKLHVVFGVQFLLCIWLLLLTFRSQAPSTVWFQDSPNNMVSFAKLSDGRLSLDVDADVIRMVKPVVYQVEGVIRNGARSWSSSVLNIYVSDSITWKWASNENVVECSDTGLLKAKTDRYIDSGDLKSDGTYIRQFDIPNTYYFCSENSQTMSGKVIVHPQPSVSVVRKKSMGSIRSIPVGVQNNLTKNDLEEMDGCWEVCYNINTDMNADVNYEFLVNQCKGDYIFLGVSAYEIPNKYLISAFGKKSVVFSKVTYASENDNVVSNVDMTLENGAYWFMINYRATMYSYSGFGGFGSATSTGSYTKSEGYRNIGFSAKEPLSADASHLASCFKSTVCEECLSLGSTQGSYIGCNNTVEKTANYKRVLMSNTCPLAVTPGAI